MTLLHGFCLWLVRTPLSEALQAREWIIPAVQTLHILAIAAVFTATTVVNLRVLNVTARHEPVATLAGRLLPCVWWGLPVLMASGLVLIVAEPARALENPVFALKMTLLCVAAALSMALQRRLRAAGPAGSKPALDGPFSRLFALLSLFLWVGIVFAGRWIAYVQSG